MTTTRVAFASGLHLAHQRRKLRPVRAATVVDRVRPAPLAIRAVLGRDVGQRSMLAPLLKQPGDAQPAAPVAAPAGQRQHRRERRHPSERDQMLALLRGMPMAGAQGPRVQGKAGSLLDCLKGCPHLTASTAAVRELPP